METVRIFDTTLRDGEQSPGATLTLPEQLEIARHLEATGVDTIEAGRPISSDGAGEAVKHAKKPRIHVFCATSKIHREHKLRKGRDEILRLSVKSIQHALQYTEDVEFSPEDASRTELDFLEEIVQAAVEAGATT